MYSAAIDSDGFISWANPGFTRADSWTTGFYTNVSPLIILDLLHGTIACSTRTIDALHQHGSSHPRSTGIGVWNRLSETPAGVVKHSSVWTCLDSSCWSIQRRIYPRNRSYKPILQLRATSKNRSYKPIFGQGIGAVFNDALLGWGA
jgi:hypothetical protein